MSEFHALRWTTPTHDSFIAMPTTQSTVTRVDWYQPGNLVLDRFNQSVVLQIPRSMPLAEVEQRMLAATKRYAVVVDDNQTVVGLLQARDLHSRHAGSVGQLLQLSWHELNAGYVMQEAERQPMITEQQLNHARIGDLAATMQAAGRDFIWVTRADEIIGVVSSLTIMAKTGESVRLYPKADTFAEVFQALKHPEILDN